MGPSHFGAGQVTMDDIATHYRVTTLLTREADMLDRWELDEWLTLFTEDAEYLVPPTDIAGDDADPDKSLFYVMDDHTRLNERVIRLKKKAAHSEWPRSKTRHLVTNTLVTPQEGYFEARSSFVVFRSKDGVTDTFIGHYIHKLVQSGDGLRIKSKKCVLDLDSLRPHGRISIIL